MSVGANSSGNPVSAKEPVSEDQILDWLGDQSLVAPPLPARAASESAIASPLVVLESFAALNRLLGEDLKWNLPSSNAAQWYRDNWAELTKLYAEMKQGAAEFQEFGLFDPLSNGLTVTPQLRGNLAHIKTFLEIGVRWVEEGSRILLPLERRSESVPGVLLKERFSISDWYDHESGRSFPIVTPELNRAASGLSELHLMKCPAHIQFERAEDVDSFVRTVQREWRTDNRSTPRELRFPMANLHLKGAIDGLIGAHADGYTIESAEFDGRFLMNQVGARAEFDFDMTCSLGVEDKTLPPRDVLIDGPFVAWFSLRGEGSILSVYVAEEQMTEPPEASV